MHLKDELEQRGFLNQYSHEQVFSVYEKGGQTLYRGCDPTADSLHLGNFVGFMHAVQWMKRGNKLILIIGGATGMIGDPGGKESERNFLDHATLTNNITAITKQVSEILHHLTTITGQHFEFEIRNNLEFYQGVGYLDFLREVGKYITVNQMMNKETVKKRIEDPDKSISYTEFSYMLLQAYDYLKLYTDHDCKLQIAGSDQWGNCITGLELIKRVVDGEAYAATCPLITDSSGKKFGKSEGNALWLDPKKNSPYVIYQYFMNTADADLARYFKLLTLTSFDEIEQICRDHAEHPQDRQGQALLASHVVETVFGKDAARQAQLISQTLFSKNDILEQLRSRPENDLIAFHQAVGKQKIVLVGERILEIVVAAGLAESNSEAKKLINDKCIYLNEQLVTDISTTITPTDFLQGKLALLRKGKKCRGSIWKQD